MIPTPRRAGANRSQGGFTLVELLVVMLIMGIVASSIVGLIVTVGRTSATFQRVQEDVSLARLGLDTVRRDLRGAHRVMDLDLNCQDWDTQRLQVWIDADDDKRMQEDELVTYTLVERDARGGQVRHDLIRTDASRTRVVARNLDGEADIFIHPHAVTGACSPPGDGSGPLLRRSLIIVRLEIDAADRSTDNLLVEAQVQLRNVRND